MTLVAMILAGFLLSTYLTSHNLSGFPIFGYGMLDIIRSCFAKVGLEEVTNCPYCASIWVAWVPALLVYVNLQQFILLTLAVAGALCLIAYVQSVIDDYLFVTAFSEDEE